MNDAEGAKRQTTPRSMWSSKVVRWTAGLFLALAAVLLSTVPFSSRPASADQLSVARAKAAQIANQIGSLQSQIDILNQQYNAANDHLTQIKDQITTTKAALVQAKVQVATDTENLRQAAIDAYISAGAQQTSNPLFATDQKTYEARAEYGHVASSKLAGDVAQLTVAQDFLATAQTQLQTQETAAQQQNDAALAAVNQNKVLQSQLDGALNGVNTQIKTLVAQQQAATLAATQASWNKPGTNYTQRTFPAPPPSPGASGAVSAALSQVGTPYVWGGSEPGGFDCSGLVMWAWGRAGVSLPHFSGAQMAATAPVPFSDLQPGDIFFYGPGGSEHEGMYVGNGNMVEATHTGSTVMVNPVRGGYVGIGRP